MTNTTDHRGAEYRRRWHPVKNMEGYQTIPSFGLIMLKQTDRDDFFTHECIDGQMVYRGWRCDEAGEASGEPYMFMLNGPVPIPPGQIGKATQDWPGLVLHDGSIDRLPNGLVCGPRKDSWYIWSTGSGFICKSHDDCRAYPHTNGLHTVEVAPSVRGQKDVGGASGADTPSAASVLSLGSRIPEEFAPPRGFSWDDSNNVWDIEAPGTYMVSVSATVNAGLGVTEGTVLRLTVYLDGSATSLTGHRLHSVDTKKDGSVYDGGDPFATAENIAFCHPLEVTDATADSPKELDLRNDSSVAIVAADVLFSIWPLSHVPAADGTLRFT